jgi:hypothetical protein
LSIIGEVRTTLLAMLAFAAALILATALPAGAQNPTLIGKVGLHNAFKITLALPDGTPVRTVPAGTYTIIVHDYSRLHNFALGSVTANKRIFTGSIRGVGTKSYTVNLTPGTYAYACSAHYGTMNGTFLVTDIAASTTTTTTTP